jgi:hypothetical protein
MIENSFIILSQLNSNSKSDNHYHHSLLPLALDRKSQKPQIVSVPGVSPKQRDRYRVLFGSEILGDFLTLDEAIARRDRSAAN